MLGRWSRELTRRAVAPTSRRNLKAPSSSRSLHVSNFDSTAEPSSIFQLKWFFQTLELCVHVASGFHSVRVTAARVPSDARRHSAQMFSLHHHPGLASDSSAGSCLCSGCWFVVEYFRLSGVCSRSVARIAPPSERARGHKGWSSAYFWEERASVEVPPAVEQKKNHKEATSAERRGSVGAPRAARLHVLISPSALNPHIVNFLFN